MSSGSSSGSRSGFDSGRKGSFSHEKLNVHDRSLDFIEFIEKILIKIGRDSFLYN